MYYIDKVTTSTILIPPDLEQVVLLRGPPVLRELVHEAGGLRHAARAAKTSSLTLRRWMDEGERPDGFCSAGTADHHSLWAGYPPPLPSLDRVVEVLTDTEPHTFLGYIEEMTPGSVNRFTGGTPFSLSMICGDEGMIEKAFEQAGIPRTTARRLSGDIPYPRAWATLDNLALHVRRQRWLECVLSCDPRRLPAPLPDEALAALIEYIGVSFRF